MWLMGLLSRWYTLQTITPTADLVTVTVEDGGRGGVLVGIVVLIHELNRRTPRERIGQG